MAKYISTKTYTHLGPVAYRQWRAESHCNLVHGYALSFHFEFESDTLDARNWVMDFGGLKPLKNNLNQLLQIIIKKKPKIVYSLPSSNLGIRITSNKKIIIIK